MNAPAPVTAASTEDKTVAILSYITIIGFIIAIILHSSKKTQLGAYHLRQVLGLIVVSFAFFFIGMILAFIPYIGWMISMAMFVVWIGMFVLWVMGLINAANGQLKPMPVLGDKFQSWFGGMFN